MGSFFGHIDEGVVFLILGYWWMYNMFRDYQKTLHTGEAFRSRISYPSTIRKVKVPLEIYLKIGFTTIAFLWEIFGPGLPVTFVDENNRFTGLKHLQHMTIYGLFMVHGLTDLLSYYKVSPIVREMKYVTVAIAFFWYGTQFYYHSADSTHKPPLENMIHRLPLTTMATLVLMFIWEMRQRDVILPQILRCLGVLMLGTWFSHVSFILYLPSPFPGMSPNPAWNQTDMMNVHFVTSLYGFHFIFNILAMLLVYTIMASHRKLVRCVKRLLGYTDCVSTYEYHKLENVENDASDKVSLLNGVELCKA